MEKKKQTKQWKLFLHVHEKKFPYAYHDHFELART